MCTRSATADSIAAALTFMRGQTFVRPNGTVIVGHSAGGWGALALAGQNPPGVAAIIAFAPGRGGHANDRPNQVCAPHSLVSAAAEFGKAARVPVIWLVARNDSYFSIALSRQLADAFRAGGDRVDFRSLPEFRSEGHWLAESDGGEAIYGPTLDNAMKAIVAKPVESAMTGYFIAKYLHVLGAIVILGTGGGIAFFMLMAHRSGDTAFIARTAATVVIADMLFTASAVVLQPVTGAALMMLSSTSLDRTHGSRPRSASTWSPGCSGSRWCSCRSKCAISREPRRPPTRRCRRAISCCIAAGSCSAFPASARSWPSCG